jgi:hypothetical protein
MRYTPTTDLDVLKPLFEQHLHALHPQAERIGHINIEVKRDYYDAQSRVHDLILRYEIKFVLGDGSIDTRSFYAKTGHPQGIASLYQLSEFLRDHGFDESSLYSIPQPRLYIEQLNLFIQEEVIGRTIHELITSKDDGLLSAIQRAASWLAFFHTKQFTATTPNIPKIRSRRPRFNFDSIDVAFAANAISSFTKEDLTALADGIVRTEQTLSSSYTPQLIHGDFHPENVFISSSKTVVIDFYESYFGDPLFDVISFRDQLSDMIAPHTSEQETKQLTDTFIDTYFSQHTGALDHLQTRLDLCGIIIRFQNLVHYMIEETVSTAQTANIERTFAEIRTDLHTLTKGLD